MTIDERLERLRERHEALTQSVEMMAADNRQTAEENKQRDRRLGEIMEGIARLLHVAEIHEHRLDDLEGEAR
jgi:archaellum component FlaC